MEKKSVRFELDGRTRTLVLPKNAKVEDIFRAAGYSNETLLATIDGKLVTQSTKASGKIKLYRVVSGG